MLMRRDPSWRHASVIWTLLTLITTAPPTIYLGAAILRAPTRSAGAHSFVILAALLLGPTLSLFFRRRWRPYRLVLLGTALSLAAAAALSGWAGWIFLPAATCALIALGTEALTAPRASSS